MESGDKVRELIRDLSADKLHTEPDGSLILKDVRLLAVGTWTDSNWGTPLFYPEAVLKEYADNWFDNPFWSRHSGGSSRSITDKIGEVTNRRYHDNAIHGDIVMHGKTQTSRDSIEMVIAGLANAVSVEHGGRERYDEDSRSYVSEDITFYGVALVNKGACDICTINNEASRSSAEANDMELKELETKLSEAEAKIKELSEASEAKDKSLSELESKVSDLDPSEKLKELEDKLKAIEESKGLSELEARVETIEKTPLPGATLAGTSNNELGEITLDPIRKDSEGMTRRMF